MDTLFISFTTILLYDKNKRSVVLIVEKLEKLYGS